MLKRFKKHLIEWVAAFAMVIASIAPTISQAISVAEQGKGFAVEVCTASGTKMVSMADDVENKHEQNKKACPYCLAHTACALPVNTTLNFAQPKALSLYPQLFYKSPKPLTAWITPPNQAPPHIA